MGAGIRREYGGERDVVILDPTPALFRLVPFRHRRSNRGLRHDDPAISRTIKLQLFALRKEFSSCEI